MRALMSLLATGVWLLAAPAWAQYQDPYGQPQEDPGYYQPPQDSGAVEAGAYGYGSIHPIPYDVGQGFCTTQTPHTHPYPPFDANLFHQQNGYFYFVGDPYDFGYTQSLFWYRGNHPVAPEAGGGYCYMGWQHRHHYPPSAQMRSYFRMTGGHFVYAGPWEQPYYQNRDRYVGYFNDYYRSSYYGNRYYRVRPRHIYRPGVGVRVNLGGMGGGIQFGVGGGFAPPPPPRPRVEYAPRVYGVPAPPPPPAYRPNYVPAPPAYGGRGGGYVPPPAPARR